jgi:hypothetical protein
MGFKKDCPDCEKCSVCNGNGEVWGQIGNCTECRGRGGTACARHR